MIKVSAKTKVIGREKLRKLLDHVQRLDESYVQVGFQGDARYPGNGPRVVEVAFWNEFGTDTTPERSFIRAPIKANKGKINEWRAEILKNVASGRFTVAKGLDALGYRIAELISNRIKSNTPPPNAPSVTARKIREGKVPKTLIDTGLMLDSLNYQVVLNGKDAEEAHRVAKAKAEREAKNAPIKAAKKAERDDLRRQQKEFKKAVRGVTKGTKRGLKKTLKQSKRGLKMALREAKKGLKGAKKAVKRFGKRRGRKPRKKP
jgi:hypothetical protein